jgi:hypothetical protein
VWRCGDEEVEEDVRIGGCVKVRKKITDVRR